MDPILAAAQTIFTPDGLFTLFIGLSVGMIVGILPALGQGTALILAMPFAFHMDPSLAFLLFAALLGSSTEGGSVTSILLNTPGTVGNLTTMFDGFPMARRGEATRALGIAGASSLFGGTFGMIILMLVIPLVRPIMYLFGAPEYFWTVFLALLVISIASAGSSIFKGLIAGAFGILISLVGFNRITGLTRYTGDALYLWDGFHIVVLVVGLFALSELTMLQAEGAKIEATKVNGAQRRGLRESVLGALEAWRSWPKLIHASFVGTIVGIVPGIGAETATYMSYSTWKLLSKDKESFGKGNPEGIMVSEAASNSKDGGALIPTLFLGIPGAPEMAILLGAFIIFGLQPGPGMALDRPDLLWTIIFSLIISSTGAGFVVIMAAPLLARITRISISMVVAVAVPLSFAAVYATRNNAWDFIFLGLFGLLGILLKRGGYPLQPLIIGYVLGPLAEKSFFVTLASSYNQLSGFFHSTLSISLSAIIGLSLVVLMLRNVYQVLKGRKSSSFQKVEMRNNVIRKPAYDHRWDKIISGGFLIAVAIFLVSMAPKLGYPASAFPLIFGTVIIVMGFVVLSSELSGRVFLILEPILGAFLREGEQRPPVAVSKLLPMLGWILGMVGFTVMAGSVLGNFIFVVGLLRVWGRKSWLTASVLAVMVSMGIYLLFVVAFEIPFWKGVIPEIVPSAIGGDELPPF